MGVIMTPFCEYSRSANFWPEFMTVGLIVLFTLTRHAIFTSATGNETTISKVIAPTVRQQGPLSMGHGLASPTTTEPQMNERIGQ